MRGMHYACPVCGTEFYRKRSSVRAKHGVHYCSRPCHMKGRSMGLTPRVCLKPYKLDMSPEAAKARSEASKRSAATRKANGFQYSESARRKMARKAAERMANAGGSGVSAMEDDVAVALDGLGIKYERQFRIMSGVRLMGVADFLLEDGRIIEFNGSYFHSDPRVYPDGPKYDLQKVVQERWDIKMGACEELGYDVLVLWEADWLERGVNALQEVLG